MTGRDNPRTVLGVRPDADQAEIHAAYRRAVRRTHPDAGGSAAEFEAVQAAYEALRDAPRGRTAGAAGRRPPTPPPKRPSPPPPKADRVGDDGSSGRRIEAILAESRRLEDEARRLAGLPPRHDVSSSPAEPAADSVGAILRDAGEQLREAADTGARELRKRLRRLL
jgi:curved DNA-binding protein CbpA